MRDRPQSRAATGSGLYRHYFAPPRVGPLEGRSASRPGDPEPGFTTAGSSRADFGRSRKKRHPQTVCVGPKGRHEGYSTGNLTTSRLRQSLAAEGGFLSTDASRCFGAEDRVSFLLAQDSGKG